MADDFKHDLKHGAQDGERVCGSERLEVERLARQHGISQVLARELVCKHGNNRAALDAEAAKQRQVRSAREPGKPSGMP